MSEGVFLRSSDNPKAAGKPTPAQEQVLKLQPWSSLGRQLHSPNIFLQVGCSESLPSYCLLPLVLLVRALKNPPSFYSSRTCDLFTFCMPPQAVSLMSVWREQPTHLYKKMWSLGIWWSSLDSSESSEGALPLCVNSFPAFLSGLYSDGCLDTG